MPINVDRFITPEQKFLGLYETAETVERKGYRDEHFRLREEERQQRAEGKRAASSRFFANYLDPNERYTGTKFDPKVYELLNNAKAQAYELAKRGADDTDILAAINPLVAQVDKYTQTAKAINEQKKAALGIIKSQRGIDPVKFSDEFDDEVFFEIDPKTGERRERDLSMIDPQENYTDRVLKNRPVYTSEGFDEFVSKAGKETTLQDVSVYDRNRAMRRTKAEITKPSFMISEKDERGAHIGFVPEYEIVTEGDQPLMHDFMTEQGVTEKAAVRMVTPEVFRSLPAASKAYLRQEAIKYAKENDINPSDPRVENFAKALAYDELKRSAKQYSTLKEVSVQKEAPIRYSHTFNFFGSDFTGGGKTTGNELDRINQNIKLPSDDYTGEWVINGAEIPKLTRAVLKTGGIQVGSKPYRLVLENGVIQEIRSVDGKELITDRDDMIIAQKKYDAERKGEGQQFGPKIIDVGEPKPKSKNNIYIWQGNEYTEDEIKQGAAAQKLSVEAYLKKHGIKKK